MMMMMCVTPGAVVYLYGCTSETEMRDVGLLDARRHSVVTHVREFCPCIFCDAFIFIM